MPYTLSATTLNLLKECPRCFWLHFNKDIKRPSGIFPSLPSGMDKVLKKHFDKYRDKDKLPPELCNEECKGLKLFKNNILEEWRNNRKGIQFKDKNDNILRGAVDNILVKDNKLIVLDYKTRGYPLKEDTAEHYQDQLDLYNFLLRKNKHETENYAYLLFYYPKEINKKGHIIFNTSLVKMKINIKNAENIWKKSIKILEGPLPNPSEECEFCKWYKELEEL